jgi:cell division transport system permease protein
MLFRILENTRKQISRSGWAGWGSISVMTMAFLVAMVFGLLAFVSNLYIRFIEQKSNILVFFEEGMDLTVVNNLKEKWDGYENIKRIEYTTEEEAYKIYSDYASKAEPAVYAVLRTRESKTLPSSLDIQLFTLEKLDETKRLIQKDIEAELEKLKIVNLNGDTNPGEIYYQYTDEPNDPPIKLVVDDENLDQLREVFFAVRIAGVAIISLLFLVIFFFTFMTVEFRLSRQMEEIGVMQLVGGSLFFIRSPYILEGGFYGALGAMISSLILGSVFTFIFVVKQGSTLTVFLYKIIGKLDWPNLSVIDYGAIILILAGIGFLLGAISSYLSIRRYIR